ncbi:MULTISPECIES: dihydroorotase [Massilia]|uniref:Dihydroorotase n=1 Tax=Massilia haematophila TaxID=457923 RepID=A0ABV7PP13_9BURK|nr:dihydroorotase [Massilia sp.]
MNLHIKNGRLIDPANGIDSVTDLFIADGKVAAIGNAPDGFTADSTIDATGLVVAPGLVDLSARLREPGYEYKATLESEMQAAIQGGVTTLVCPPDTDPVLDEPGLVEMLKHRARNLNQANVHPLGALTMGLKGQALTEMAELTEAGCIGFAQAEVPILDTNVLLRALQYAKTFGYTVWLRPQDPHIGRGGVAHSGPLATRLGLSGVPVMAETIALHTIFELVRSTGARVHLCRMSSSAGLELVRAAKAEGLPVTCDVGVHHLHMTDADIGFFDSNARLTPPLRTQRDRDAIRAALLDGTIDAVCSDHTPVDDDEKLLPFGEASPGATGLELLLSLTLKWAEELHGDTALVRALAKITSQAARTAGLDAGHLAPGAAADVVVFDPAQRWLVEGAALASQGKHTPFLGYELTGQVKATVVGGRVAYQR